ncbi:MAG: hypothetical protein NTV22_06885 [bacterium]|nr:hypothetical protein [bacterium]
MVIAPRFLWLFVFACCTLAYTPALDAARPTGRLPVKFAFLNYEPFFEYTNGVPFNKYYWQAFGDLDPHACIDMLSEGWRRTTDNMLDIQVVYTTNVDLFPYHATVNASNQHRYTDSTYWNHAGSRFAGENSNGFTDLSDYITCITADFPQVIGMTVSAITSPS